MFTLFETDLFTLFETDQIRFCYVSGQTRFLLRNVCRYNWDPRPDLRNTRRSWCLCNLARGCKLAHRPQRLPEQLDHAESIALVRGRPFVSSWVELVIAQSVTADRRFFRSCEQHSLNRPPKAPYCAGFARINPQRSRQKRPPIRQIPDPQVN